MIQREAIEMIEELVSASHEPTIPVAPLPTQGPPYVALPEGYRLQTVHVPDFPTRIVQQVIMHDAVAFSRYIQQFCLPGTMIFLDEEQRTYRAILDYHSGGAGDESQEFPRWCDHLVTYTAATSTEWNTWIGRDRQTFTQAQFAAFLEDNQLDAVKPAGAQLLEIAKTLEAKADVSYSSAIRLESGAARLHFDETIKGTACAGTVEIPRDIVLGIPVLKNGPVDMVSARFKYRLKDRQLMLWYEIARPEKVLERNLAVVTAAIEQNTSLAIHKGAPQLKRQ
jgi:uncharacterized protein YfdQ (DUF2303 family)